jgi:hypothetical protein
MPQGSRDAVTEHFCRAIAERMGVGLERVNLSKRIYKDLRLEADDFDELIASVLIHFGINPRDETLRQHAIPVCDVREAVDFALWAISATR